MKTHEQELWDMIYEKLDEYLDIGAQSLRLWFGAMEIGCITENAVYFSTDNLNKKKVVEKNYIEGLRNAVKDVFGYEPKIYVISTERDDFRDGLAELLAGNPDELKSALEKICVTERHDENVGYETDSESGYRISESDGERDVGVGGESGSDYRSEAPGSVRSRKIPYLAPPDGERPEFNLSSRGKTRGELREGAMKGMRGVDPQKTYSNPDVPEVPDIPRPRKTFTMTNVPKRYNPEKDAIETVPLGKFYEDRSHRNGVMIVSPGAPKWKVGYTFENFVVGESNKFAYHYCYQVSQYPAQQYNPLFIYGDPGLGKTHLLYAITHEIEQLHPSMNIVYIKGDDFTNELVEAISSKSTSYFRDKYRNADMFLMDDVQFIAGKPATQEEFFHTYESLFQTGKQIIMTSDVAPKNIKNLEERLRSRFESGIVIGIDSPDTELRTAIFKNKAVMLGVSVPNDVLVFLAQTIKDNIRQIEGILKKLNSISMIENRPVDMELAKKCVSDIVDLEDNINEQVIINTVSRKYGIEIDALLGKKKTKDIVSARHVAVYLIRKMTDLSLPDIGKVFNRDHSTIMHSVDKIQSEVDDSPERRKEIDDLMELVRTKR